MLAKITAMLIFLSYWYIENAVFYTVGHSNNTFKTQYQRGS
jgi:hypothetical protein